MDLKCRLASSTNQPARPCFRAAQMASTFALCFAVRTAARASDSTRCAFLPGFGFLGAEEDDTRQSGPTLCHAIKRHTSVSTASTKLGPTCFRSLLDMGPVTGYIQMRGLDENKTG